LEKTVAGDYFGGGVACSTLEGMLSFVFVPGAAVGVRCGHPLLTPRRKLGVSGWLLCRPRARPRRTGCKACKDHAPADLLFYLLAITVFPEGYDARLFSPPGFSPPSGAQSRGLTAEGLVRTLAFGLE